MPYFAVVYTKNTELPHFGALIVSTLSVICKATLDLKFHKDIRTAEGLERQTWKMDGRQVIR